MVIAFPKSMQDQRRVIAQLDALAGNTRRLARFYERKVATLEVLKKSVLHQAFAGNI
jgi:type I restriction enzyme S subunit